MKRDSSASGQRGESFAQNRKSRPDGILRITGNPGDGQGELLRATAPALDPTSVPKIRFPRSSHVHSIVSSKIREVADERSVRRRVGAEIPYVRVAAEP